MQILGLFKTITKLVKIFKKMFEKIQMNFIKVCKSFEQFKYTVL